MKNYGKKFHPLKFQQNFAIKDAVYLLEEAWDYVKSITISRAWNNLWLMETNGTEQETMDKAPNSLNLQLTLQNLNETLKLALEDDPLNTLTSDDLKDWIKEDTNELQKNSMVESLQNDLDCQEIQDESNSPDNGENMKDDEEDWDSVEKAIDEVIKFMEKKIFIQQYRMYKSM